MTDLLCSDHKINEVFEVKEIFIINGPNLNMLGVREPEIYGAQSLNELQSWTESQIGSQAKMNWYQSNIEGEIVEKIQHLTQLSHQKKISGLIINPGAYAHTSVAIYDALKMLTIPVIEVHLTQLYRRESFRHTLLTAKAASAIMSGFGQDSYYLAVQAILNHK